MYIAYFININTGQIIVSHNPSQNPSHVSYPQYNAEGWSRINENLYNLLDKVKSFYYATGIMESDKS